MDGSSCISSSGGSELGNFKGEDIFQVLDAYQLIVFAVFDGVAEVWGVVVVAVVAGKERK